jgi:lipopolysaccharide biosynthesis glycosyltransferase
MHKIYLGYDSREPDAYKVAEHSLAMQCGIRHQITPIRLDKLERLGLMTRKRRYVGEQMYDVISDAPMSTEFAIARFATPLLAQTGWALFADPDVVFLYDICELFKLADPRKAVMVVKHEHKGMEGEKMDGRLQTMYRRKNWSSVMLFNCDHPANDCLTIGMLNGRPGRDLHAFYWLEDDLIGELPPEWNWLVGVQPKPRTPKIAHFTLGGPWFPTWKGAEHDEIWIEAATQAGLSYVRNDTKGFASAMAAQEAR